MNPVEVTGLEVAWQKRERWGVFKHSQAIRVFYGPGEGEAALGEIAIDRFGDHYWITQWQKTSQTDAVLECVGTFLKAKGARSAVALFRPETGVPEDPQVILGSPPSGKFEVTEGKMKFWIQFLQTKHPGLFLDHAPLREWLLQNSSGRKVLNTFAYTGSLSVACGVGGASHVTTLDLSRPTIEWAKENWSLNQLPGEKSDFIYGDYFEWLPKFSKNQRRFDGMIIDPPSFSRGKRGKFSTSKDLLALHELAMAVLNPGAFLATSINSANVSRRKFFFEIQLAAAAARRKVEIIHEVELPRTFPTRSSSEEDRYLKGWILKVS